MNKELDACLGLLHRHGRGYDPYAAAGALANLSVATGRSGLMSQFEDSLSGEVHGSFNDRIATVYDNVVMVCSVPDVKPICDYYKSVIRPQLPGTAPLRERKRIE